MSATVNGKAYLIQNESKTRNVIGWKVEWFQEEGDKIIKNRISMYNTVKKEGKTPKQRSETTTKPIYKEEQKKNRWNLEGNIYNQCNF